MTDQPAPQLAPLPCPFCGNGAAEYDAAAGIEHEVNCSNADCSVTACVFAPTRAEAIARWNTRAPVGPQFSIGIEDVYTPGEPGKTYITAIGPEAADWTTPAAKLFKSVLNFLADRVAPQTVAPNDRH